MITAKIRDNYGTSGQIIAELEVEILVMDHGITVRLKDDPEIYVAIDVICNDVMVFISSTENVETEPDCHFLVNDIEKFQDQ